MLCKQVLAQQEAEEEGWALHRLHARRRNFETLAVFVFTGLQISLQKNKLRVPETLFQSINYKQWLPHVCIYLNMPAVTQS